MTRFHLGRHLDEREPVDSPKSDWPTHEPTNRLSLLRIILLAVPAVLAGRGNARLANSLVEIADTGQVDRSRQHQECCSREAHREPST